jgi:quercetin dioxygenase-like cupin family protein
MGILDTNGRAAFRAEKLTKVNLFENAQMFCDLYCLEPGQEQAVHEHAGATKFYYVLEGRVAITIGDDTQQVGAGALGWSAPGEPHGVRNDGDARAVLLVAMAPHPRLG